MVNRLHSVSELSVCESVPEKPVVKVDDSLLRRESTDCRNVVPLDGPVQLSLPVSEGEAAAMWAPALPGFQNAGDTFESP